MKEKQALHTHSQSLMQKNPRQDKSPLLSPGPKPRGGKTKHRGGKKPSDTVVSPVNGKTIIIKRRVELMDPIKANTKSPGELAAQTLQSQ